MARIAILFMCLCSVLLTGCPETNSGVKFSDDAKVHKIPYKHRNVLENASSFKIYSLFPPKGSSGDPPPAGSEKFHGYPSFGAISFDTVEQRREAISMVYGGIVKNDGTVAACFWPRHGIRAEFRGEVTDLVICYQCSHVYVYEGEERVASVPTEPFPAEYFNELLSAGGIKLDKDKS